MKSIAFNPDTTLKLMVIVAMVSSILGCIGGGSKSAVTQIPPELASGSLSVCAIPAAPMKDHRTGLQFSAMATGNEAPNLSSSSLASSASTRLDDAGSLKVSPKSPGTMHPSAPGWQSSRPLTSPATSKETLK